jgi:hypothetical protein
MLAVQPVFSSADLGSVQVNGSAPGSATLSFNLSNQAGTPTAHLQYQVDYTLGQISCSGNGTLTCTVPVTFAPHSAGVRQDAVRIFNTGGTVVAIAFLHGIGLAPQAVLLPGVISSFAGTGTWGNSGDGGLAASAKLGNPQGLTMDAAGNLYIADSLDQVVRRVNTTTNIITTVAGNAAATSLGDGGPATSAN